MNGWVKVATATLIAILSGQSVLAHQVPNSVVDFDFGSSTVKAELLLPDSELRCAFGAVLVTNSPEATERYDESLRGYILRHVHVETPQGTPWTVYIDAARPAKYEAHDYFDVRLTMRPPAGESSRHFVFFDDAITHEVMNHYIMLVARSDYATGLVGPDSQIIGFLQHPRNSFAIDRSAPQAGSGFLAAFRLGVVHIAAGTDHLLFLLTLLLPASLIAVRGRWQGRRKLGATLRRLATIVSAFTLGHSLTLAGSVAFGWELRAQPVEILIALSILVTAIHAWRPLFPGREPQIAAGFGLVHGLAFAATLGAHVVDPSSKAYAILGFNLGIETLQLALVAAAAPLLCLLRATGISVLVRRMGAAFAGITATFWAFERMGLAEQPQGRFGSEMLANIAVSIFVAFVVVMILILARGRSKAITPTHQID
jgi:hypothetical protein